MHAQPTQRRLAPGVAGEGGFGRPVTYHIYISWMMCHIWQIIRSLRYCANGARPPSGIAPSTAERLAFINETRLAFGRTALLLSGDETERRNPRETLCEPSPATVLGTESPTVFGTEPPALFGRWRRVRLQARGRDAIYRASCLIWQVAPRSASSTRA